MSTTTFLVSTAGSLAASLLFLHVGNVLRRRRVSPEAGLANRMFVLWWMCLGGLGIFGAIQNLAYLAGALPIWLYQATTVAVLAVLFLGLWGLQFYLVYLYTGSRRSFAPLGVFYGLIYFATLALVSYIGTPEAIVDDGWSLRAEPEVEFGVLFSLSFVLLIVGPQVAAAVAYARLYRRADDRTQRYRIAMVTTAILVWFGSSIIATLLDISEATSWRLASRVIGILAALAILFAYRPPQSWQTRYQLDSVELAARSPVEPPTRPSL